MRCMESVVFFCGVCRIKHICVCIVLFLGTGGGANGGWFDCCCPGRRSAQVAPNPATVLNNGHSSSRLPTRSAPFPPNPAETVLNDENPSCCFPKRKASVNMLGVSERVSLKSLVRAFSPAQFSHLWNDLPMGDREYFSALLVDVPCQLASVFEAHRRIFQLTQALLPAQIGVFVVPPSCRLQDMNAHLVFDTQGRCIALTPLVQTIRQIVRDVDAIGDMGLKAAADLQIQVGDPEEELDRGLQRRGAPILWVALYAPPLEAIRMASSGRVGRRYLELYETAYRQISDLARFISCMCRFLQISVATCMTPEDVWPAWSFSDTAADVHLVQRILAVQYGIGPDAWLLRARVQWEHGGLDVSQPLTTSSPAPTGRTNRISALSSLWADSPWRARKATRNYGGQSDRSTRPFYPDESSNGGSSLLITLSPLSCPSSPHSS